MKNTELSFALHLARNSKDSRFGLALLEENTKETRLLDTRIQRLEKERYRKSLHAAQVRNMFLHERASQPEPLLIVERPPSPDVLRRVAIIEQGLDDEVPSYAKPLKTKTRAPSTLLTIDAFAVKNRKKKNVWEDAMRGSEPASFQSKVIPSFPLTVPEAEELDRGRRVHRPRSFPSNKSRTSRAQGKVTSVTPGAVAGDLEDARRNLVDNSGTFITQIPTDGGTLNAKSGRMVKFTFKADEVNNKGKNRRLPMATALVATRNGFQIQKTSSKSKEEKSEELRASLRKWLRNTKDLM